MDESPEVQAPPLVQRVNRKIPPKIKDMVERAERSLVHRAGGNRSAVMKHPRHLEISYAIVRKEKTHKQISEQYGIAIHNITRHAKRLRQAVEAYAEAKGEQHIKTLDEMVQWHFNAAREGFDLAKETPTKQGTPHFGAMHDFLAQAARSIEIRGDLSGMGSGLSRDERRGAGQILIQNMIGLPKVGAGVPGRVLEHAPEPEAGAE